MHGEKYNYDLVNYKGNKTKVKILCIEHNVFEQSPKSHLHGSGCTKYGLLKIKTSRYLKEDIIKMTKEAHDDKYDYSKFEFINMSTKTIVICPKHGEYEIEPIIQLNHGCKKCYYDIIGNNNRKSFDNFLQKANKKHNNFYDYSKVNYIDSSTKIEIICPKHGSFWQVPSLHYCGNGCPICKMSKGEREIEIFLINHNIKYTKQFIFNDCRLKNPLSFDFYLSDYNICIEFDGRQHSSKNKQQSLYFDESISVRDNIKNEYCKKNNIILIRIKYSVLNNIHSNLSKIFKKYKIISNIEKRERFIKKAIELWGYKYDYSKVDYIDYKTNVIIGYKGLWYKQTPNKHLQGKRVECQQSKISNDNFIIMSKKIWKDRYDYSECEYLGTNSKVRLYDKLNDRWIEQTSKSHIKGYEVTKLSSDEYIDKCLIMHDYMYEYDISNYQNLSSRILINCKKHGKFELKASTHIYGSGCPKCDDYKFKKEIRKMLNNNKITFVENYKFTDCRNKYQLPFDFYIPSIRTIIEFNGKQHYEPIEHFGGVENYNRLKTNDKIKEDYCEENYINLIIIKYDQYDDIWSILLENLKLFIKSK